MKILFRKLAHYRPVAVLTLIAVLITASLAPAFRGIFFADLVSAVGGYSAADMLGELDSIDQPNYTVSGANDAPSSRGFSGPHGGFIDTVGHRYFVPEISNSRILVFNLDSGNNLVDREADFVLGQPDFKHNSAALTQSGLAQPESIALDVVNQRLFVADRFNERVIVYDVATITNGENAINVIGQDDFVSSGIATTQDGVAAPVGVELDEAGQRLFVSDNGNNRVLVFDVDPAVLVPNDTGSDGPAAINVLGHSDYVTQTGGTSQNTLSGPQHTEYDDINQRLFVTESNRVMVFDVDPAVLIPNNSGTDGPNAINVIGQPDFVTGNGALTQSKLRGPQGVSLDVVNQRLFVADTENSRIMVFDVDPAVLIPNDSGSDGPAAINVLGEPDFVTTNDGSITTRSTLYLPGEGKYNPDTNELWVTDFGPARVMVFDVDPAVLVANTPATDGPDAVNLLGQFDENGDPVYTASGPDNSPNAQGFSGPAQLAIDSVGHRLFTVDTNNSRVMVFNLDSSNHPIDHTADFVLGQPDVKTAVPDTTQSKMSAPMGVAYDSGGQRLFVADSSNNRVLVFDVASITNGENAINVIGQANFTSSGTGTTVATVSNPTGLAYDGDNQRLFVSDFGNSRILVFDVDPAVLIPNNSGTDGPDAINVIGQIDFTSGDDPNAATAGEVCHPNGLAYDSSGQRLFVPDSGQCGESSLPFSRVLVFDVDPVVLIPNTPPTDGPDAVNVLGQPDFVSGDPATTQSGVNNPVSVAYESTGDLLYVGDSGNARVLVFDANPTVLIPGNTGTDGPDAIDVYGQDDFVTPDAVTAQDGFSSTTGVATDSAGSTLYVDDGGNNRAMIFDVGAAPTPTPTPTPTATPGPGGGGGSPPTDVGFTPRLIVANDDDPTTPSRNVIVKLYADQTSTFTGTVDVLLSNDPQFGTFIPFRFNVPSTTWPQSVPWDLCFGLGSGQTCNPGNKIVYARFYVNVPAPTPILPPVQ